MSTIIAQKQTPYKASVESSTPVLTRTPRVGGHDRYGFGADLEKALDQGERLDVRSRERSR